MERGLRLGVLVVLLMVVCVPAASAQGIVRDKVIFNDSYTLPAGETLRGNLALIGGSALLEQESAIDGDVVVVAGHMVADGTITGSVAIFGGRLTLGESALVKGDLASLGSQVDLATGAEILGRTLLGLNSLDLAEDRSWPPRLVAKAPLGDGGGWLRQVVVWEVRTFGFGLLLALLGAFSMLVAPRGVRRVATAAATQPAVSFGMGLLTLLVAGFAGALLLIACGLGLVVWLALVLGLTLGWMGVGLWLGQRLMGALGVRTTSSVAEIVAGVFLITVLAALPLCIGFLAWLVIGSIGLGAVVLTRFGTEAAENSGQSPLAAPLPPGEETARDPVSSPDPALTEPPSGEPEPPS